VLGQVADQTLDVLELVGRISLSTTGHVMFGYDAFDCTDLQQPNTLWQVRRRYKASIQRPVVLQYM
jgi:hypothetical protein